MLITSFLIIWSFPSLTAGQVMLLVDRFLGGHFFDAGAGGAAILWQHLFWAFGHPEVYILVLPAFGIISEVMPGLLAQADLRLPLRGGGDGRHRLPQLPASGRHHMFAVGLGPRPTRSSSALSMLIAMPTGIKIFNWLATMWGGAIRCTTAMLLPSGSSSMFVIGGLTRRHAGAGAIRLAGHRHVLRGGPLSLRAIGGTDFRASSPATYYWFPKMTGRLLSERLGQVALLADPDRLQPDLLPPARPGLIGMPRRVYTYPALHGLG